MVMLSAKAHPSGIIARNNQEKAVIFAEQYSQIQAEDLSFAFNVFQFSVNTIFPHPSHMTISRNMALRGAHSTNIRLGRMHTK